MLDTIKIENKEYSCSILAQYGAALNSYKLNEKEFVFGYNNFSETNTQKYKGVILAPFPNRIAEAKYTFEGKDFKLPINREKEALAMHGFLYNKSFQLIKQEQNAVILQYDYSATISAYPFPFTVMVAYELLENGLLKIKTVIRNTGDNKMPFGTGWHPYFKIDTSINTMQLKMPACQQLELKNNIPTGSIIDFLKNESILNLKEHHFDDCFVFNTKNKIDIQLIGKEYQLNISAKCQNNYPYFQIYTPSTRDSIAIEPMTCAPNAFNNKMGLLEIKPGQSFSFEYELFGEAL